MISASTSASRPQRVPSAMASAVPIICTASSRLLHSLASWPALSKPAWKMLRPMAARIGRAFSSVTVAPPTMKVRLPDAAPAVPPDTGASSMATPWAAAARWTRRAVAGAMVEHSSTRRPAGRAASKPSSPRYRSSTWRPAGSMLITASASCAASRAEVAARAPSLASWVTTACTRSKPLTV